MVKVRPVDIHGIKSRTWGNVGKCDMLDHDVCRIAFNRVTFTKKKAEARSEGILKFER